MSPEPLAVVALVRQLIQNEITLGILRSEVILLGVNSLSHPQIKKDILSREISKLEKDCSDLTRKLVNEVEK